MRHRALLALLTMLVAMSAGCGRHGDGTDTSRPVELGHESAWMVAHADHTDTIALQRALIDARARHDRFVLVGDENAARQFEQAFRDSLRRIDPQLARVVFPDD